MSTSFLTPGAHLIPLDEAEEMNKRYRDNKERILAEGIDTDTLPICETFNRDDFDTLLGQTGCVGVRLYYSMDENDKVCIVAVGVNDQDEDIIDKIGKTSIILDHGVRCPIHCPPSSPLNS